MSSTQVRRSQRANAGQSPERYGREQSSEPLTSGVTKSQSDKVQSPSLFALPVREAQARKLEWLLVTAQVGVGLFHSNPELWYLTFAQCVVILLVGTLGTAVLFQVFVQLLAKVNLAYLIQTSSNAQPTNVRKEVADTVIGYGVVVGAMMAWPVTNYKLGRPTALQYDLDDCVPVLPYLEKGTAIYSQAQVAYYLVKMVLGLLAADAYNYWKHRWFHHKNLWAFHKTHHSHHNPSALGGYAVSPMFGFATFLPVYLFVLPELGLYPPLHWPVLLFYLGLNHYLHCGYVVPAIETVLSPFFIMTSKWHNVHHEKGRVGFDYKAQTFGEMFSIWDYVCGTYPQGHYQWSGSASKKL